jgi:hypothetical protein
MGIQTQHIGYAFGEVQQDVVAWKWETERESDAL